MPRPTAAQIVPQEIPEPVAVRKLDVRFDNLSMDKGLSQSQVYSITQDHNGFLWFGTQDGLNRYDGHEFKAYQHIPFDSTSMPDGWALSTREDEKGNLWVATTKGLAMLDPLTDRFTRFDLMPKDSAAAGFNWAWSVVTDRNGLVWIGTSKGLLRLDPATRKLDRFRSNPDDPTSLSRDMVWNLKEDQEGRLYSLTPNGINRFDPDEPGRFERLLHDPRPRDDWYFAHAAYDLLFDAQSSLAWVTTDTGLIHVDLDTGAKERYCHDDSERFKCFYRGISADPITSDVYWVTTDLDGLVRFNARNGTFVRYGSDPSEPNAIRSNNLGPVFADRSGVMWVSSVGIDRFNPVKSNRPPLCA